MSETERGEPNVYEITWRTGHIERVLAHQVSWPNQAMSLYGGILTAAGGNGGGGRSRMHFHAEIDGKWTLTLAADEDDILSIRLVTESEPIPDGAS